MLYSVAWFCVKQEIWRTGFLTVFCLPSRLIDESTTELSGIAVLGFNRKLSLFLDESWIKWFWSFCSVVAVANLADVADVHMVSNHSNWQIEPSFQWLKEIRNEIQYSNAVESFDWIRKSKLLIARLQSSPLEIPDSRIHIQSLVKAHHPFSTIFILRKAFLAHFQFTAIETCSIFAMFILSLRDTLGLIHHRVGKLHPFIQGWS